MNRQGPGKIENIDYNWTPQRGCRNQELGVCGIQDCHAWRNAVRFGIPKGEERTPERIEQALREARRPRFVEHVLEEPLRVKKPSRIGVCWTGELFGPWVPRENIERVLDVCRRAHWHRFLLLTKNPARYAEFDIPGNCWCGTSITGTEIDRPRTLRDSAPRERSFVSLEPYTGGPVSSRIFDFNWIIVGGLSGRNAAHAPAGMLATIGVIASHTDNVWLFYKSNTGYSPLVQQYPADLRLE